MDIIFDNRSIAIVDNGAPSRHCRSPFTIAAIYDIVVISIAKVVLFNSDTLKEIAIQTRCRYLFTTVAIRATIAIVVNIAHSDRHCDLWRSLMDGFQEVKNLNELQ